MKFPLPRPRRRGREALRRANDELNMLVRASPLGIVALDRQGLVTRWSPAAERIFGWREQEALGRFYPAVPEGMEHEFQALLERILGGDIVTGAEVRRRRKDGSPIDISVSGAPLRDRSGAAIGVIALVADVTDRKRVEEEIRLLNEELEQRVADRTANLETVNRLLRESEDELRAAKEEAEQANRAKSEFLSRVSHELRTPLNAILGFGQLLELDWLAREQSESVQHILRGGRHLLALIDEVLEISRLESGTLTFSPEPVDIASVVAESLELLRPLAADRRIALGEPEEACDRHVLADRQRLKQVLLNLLSNAVKYNRPGGAVTVACAETPGGRLRIQVTDTGPGIAPEHVERLFTPFDRLGAESSETDGTGLGLALSKRLVEAMGGEIDVESQPGVGTTFVVELPLAEALPEREPHLRGPVAEVATGNGGRHTALYIEDNLPNFRLVERILGRCGVQLEAAMLGRLGLELAREHRPDLVLLDLQLPDLPGEEVLARLRSEPETKAIPVIVISADATPGRPERLLAAGASACVTKPFRVAELVEAVNGALAGRGAQMIDRQLTGNRGTAG